MALRDSSTRVIRAVRAEAARYGYSGKDIAKALGRDPKYVYERFRFQKPFSTEDLNQVAEWLGITFDDLIKSADFDASIHQSVIPASDLAA
ncbi:MAG: helix-turn-helix transcriptional regulator [Bifidobacteriales bacterium]|nr:helix-turn-helix transcriptional regulator [Bifidobacteriales bacterium]PXY83632.1 hypothetical protein DKK73_05350 [Bifidobacterium asteroides]